MTLEKPQLRRLLATKTVPNLIGLVACAVGVLAFYKLGIIEPKKRKYEEYFKHYDPDQALKKMIDANLMQSHPV